MASPLAGSIGEFDTSTETFTAYHERLEQYFVANSIGLYSSEASDPNLLKQLRTRKKRYSDYFSYRQEDIRNTSRFVQSRKSKGQDIQVVM